MSGNSRIITVVIAVFFANPVFGQDRIRVENDLQSHFDRNRDGWLAEAERDHYAEVMHIREKIRRLDRLADEAQERSNRLRAEAAELEGRLRRELERQKEEPRRQGPEAIERKIHEMLEKAEHMEREGMIDKARILRREAEKLADGLRRHQRDRELAEMKERIAHLRELAARAKKEGDMEKARDLWEESRHLENRLKRRIEQEHRHKEAVEREFALTKERIVHLRRMSGEAERTGDIEKAKRLWAEAEELKRHLSEGIEERRYRADGHDDDGEELEEMRGQLERLRDEVNKLREIVEMLADKLSDR